MSLNNLYIGDASDPKFHWDGGDYSGNIPEIILDLGGIGLMGCVEARSLLESPKYGGRVLDWGSSGARLTKERIIEFLNEFDPPRIISRTAAEHIQALEADKEYILFACEQ
jgi:hypothetical protein